MQSDQISGKPTILVVDDDPTTLRLLMEILGEGYTVCSATSGERALELLADRQPDIILLDLEMPGMSGRDVMRRLKADGHWADIPVVLLIGAESREKEQEALDLGAVDYILKPVMPGTVKARVGMHAELTAYRRRPENIVDTRTQQLGRTQDVLLDILASVTACRDNEIGAHIKRTTIFAQKLVENLLRVGHPMYDINAEYADCIIKSCKLHDIGKVAIPDNILLKPTQLTPFEYAMIKQHTLFGARVIDEAIGGLATETPFFFIVAREIIIAHHEKWDGSGYPFGLSGEAIPLSARIMSIVDVYDALVSHRPYKPSHSHEKAVSTLLQDAGAHFDPVLIELSRDVLDDFRLVELQVSDDPLFGSIRI